MVIKLLKPVPLINRVFNAGDYVDSEKIFVELIQTGRAELADGKMPDTDDPETPDGPDGPDAPDAPDAPDGSTDVTCEGGDGSTAKVNVSVHVSSDSKAKRSSTRKKTE